MLRKLSAKKTGLYKAKTVQSYTVTMENNEVLDPVSRSRLFITQRNDKNEPLQVREENVRTKKNNQLPKERTEDDTDEDKYVVKKIVSHTIEDGRTQYRLRWYGHTSVPTPASRKNVFQIIFYANTEKGEHDCTSQQILV